MNNKKPPFEITNQMIDYVVEIAELVGYNNSNSLIRAYKKYRGITPGKYRELLFKENTE